MPKIVVVCFGSDTDTTSAAHHAARGAKSIRFAEVDSLTGTRATAESLRQYDGIVFVDSAENLRPHLERMRAQDAFTNIVIGALGPDLPAELLAVGAIVATIPPAPAALDGSAGAEALGARVAKVAGWVHHALSHEHGHHHHH